MRQAASRARIAFVVPRYGRRVVGGAETLCRMLAENLSEHGTAVDVLTTCAMDHFTWRDELPAGTTQEGGVTVRRFPVGPRDTESFLMRHGLIDYGAHLTYGEQVGWMADSVWSPGILEASAEYEWIIAMPYLFGTTFWSAVAYPERTVMVPCLHDEHHARQDAVLDAISACRGVMLNASGEGRLLDRLLQERRPGTTTRNPPVVVGGGFHEEPPPDPEAVAAFLRSRGIRPGYLLYAGRRERAKGLPELFEHYRAYRAAVAEPRLLALMGSGDLTPPRDLVEHIVDLGFVSEQERTLAYAAAGVLVQPSRLESFGLVVFEAWLAGTPVVVNRRSEVLRGHCDASGGGLHYDDSATFTEAVLMAAHEPAMRERLVAAGREYTLTDFRWDAVRRRFHHALEAWS